MSIGLISIIGIILMLMLLFTQFLYDTMVSTTGVDEKSQIFKGFLFFITFVLSPAFLIGWIITIFKTVYKHGKNQESQKSQDEAEKGSNKEG